MNDRQTGVLAVVLAAGQGTRMRSSMPKVLHRAAGRPLLDWVVRAARQGGCHDIAIVVGHGAATVQETFSGQDLVWVTQEEQRGTGHALAQTRAAVAAADADLLLVLSGDVPLVTAATFDRLIQAARSGWGALAVAEVDDPGSLGRVLARPEGALQRIVEAVDATAEELDVRVVNAGIYALPATGIFGYLDALRPDNAKGELYLTDALNDAAADGKDIRLVELTDAAEAMGVNTRADLAAAHGVLLGRHGMALMEAGVTILDPARVAIEPSVGIGPDSVIHPGVSLLGETVVGAGCELHQGAWLRNATLGDGSVVYPYSVLDGASVAAACQIGPFARLRPGTVIGSGTKVGNFVEIKNSVLAEGVKANHLAYLGDATVGASSNIGAGTVTCNYDGFAKHRTTIGQGVLVGSDTMLIAPVEVGDGAMTAAGSVVSKNVPAGALAVARAPQRNLLEWVKRFRLRKRK